MIFLYISSRICYDTLRQEDKILNEYYFTIDGTVSGEIVEKRSRFICTLAHVSDEEEAAAFIGSVRKKYYDARHNCSAYILGCQREITRSSDDGEPSGTAGRPMTDVLAGAELSYTAAVVTRYFGGTLLGTGGLIRAYSQAVKAALENAVLIKMINAVRFRAEVTYNDLNLLMKIISTENIKQISSEYGEKIIFELQVPANACEGIVRKLTEATLGKAVLSETAKGFFEE